METYDEIQPAELSDALAYLLAAPTGNKTAARGPIDGFRNYLAQSSVQWQGLRAGPPDRPTGLIFALLLPGRTAIVIAPNPGRHGIDRRTQSRITAAGLARLAEHHLHFAQTLVEPGATAKQDLLEQAGFKLLTPLIYLERDVTYPWTDPPAPDAATWITYTPATHDEFIQTLRATYRGSLDCPELSDLRPTSDALLAHHASGRFDPRYWELARIDGQIAGCLLLAPLTHGPVMEVVYMGVCPHARRRGVGTLLIRRALEQCRHANLRRLTLVVDARNTPAQKLYERFALQQIARRNASLYVWPPSDA